jgi:hypothetical protein
MDVLYVMQNVSNVKRRKSTLINKIIIVSEINVTRESLKMCTIVSMLYEIP